MISRAPEELTPVIAIPSFTGHYGNENHTDQETSDVGPPCDAPCVGGTGNGERCGAFKKLHEEPETQHNDGRYFDDLNEKKDWKESQNPRVRIGNDIRAQHAGDRPAGADARHGA